MLSAQVAGPNRMPFGMNRSGIDNPTAGAQHHALAFKSVEMIDA